MSDAPAPPEPRGVRDAIVHAAVVAAAWSLGNASTWALAAVTTPGLWDILRFELLIDILRRSTVVGIAAALAAHRRQTCTRQRAALECAALAVVALNVGRALWIGGVLTRGGFRGGATGLDSALEQFLEDFRSWPIYASMACLAVGLYLAGSRRGSRWEGLALKGPAALSLGLTTNLVSVPVVAIALPLLSRAADRLLARRERET